MIRDRDREPEGGPYEYHDGEHISVGTDDTPLSPRAQQALDEYDRRHR